MFSTRLHGVIDCGVAALFGRLARSEALAPELRATFGPTGAYHGTYALMVD